MKLQKQVTWVSKISKKETKPNVKEVKELKKKLKQIEAGVEDFSEKRSNSYTKDIEHNINAWCSIWEDSKKAKAYREQWNWIYKQMAKWWEE